MVWIEGEDGFFFGLVVVGFSVGDGDEEDELAVVSLFDDVASGVLTGVLEIVLLRGGRPRRLGGA